jgi:hypothetical protein
MKKLWLVMAVMLLVVALGASGAMATYMNLEVDSSWSFTINGQPAAQLGMVNVSNHAEVVSNSTNPVETVVLTVNNTGPGVGASVSINSLPNLLHQEASNTPGVGGSLVSPSHTHVSGQGPTEPGFLQQNAYEYMLFSFTPNVTANYNIVATNNFSAIMTGTNASGVGAYSVGQTYTYTSSLTGGGLTVSKGGVTDFSNIVAIGNTVPPWDNSQADNVSLDMGINQLTGGVTYNIKVSDKAYQYMYTSQVPVPPTALLLGSGLLGLALLGRRKFGLKK